MPQIIQCQRHAQEVGYPGLKRVVRVHERDEAVGERLGIRGERRELAVVAAPGGLTADRAVTVPLDDRDEVLPVQGGILDLRVRANKKGKRRGHHRTHQNTSYASAKKNVDSFAPEQTRLPVHKFVRDKRLRVQRGVGESCINQDTKETASLASCVLVLSPLTPARRKPET